MVAPFDPYLDWLGIPPEQQPPDHYTLLGVPRFEPRADVIADAVNRRMALVQGFATGPYAGVAAKVLHEITAARLCLESATGKAAYDATLRSWGTHRKPVTRPVPLRAAAVDVILATAVPSAADAAPSPASVRPPLPVSAAPRKPAWRNPLLIGALLAAAALAEGGLLLLGVGHKTNNEQASGPATAIQDKPLPSDAEPSGDAKSERDAKPPPPTAHDELIAVPITQDKPGPEVVTKKLPAEPPQDAADKKLSAQHAVVQSTIVRNEPVKTVIDVPKPAELENFPPKVKKPKRPKGSAFGHGPGARPAIDHTTPMVDLTIRNIRSASKPRQKTTAIDRLVRYGPDAAAATPVLIDSLQDPSSDVRTSAMRALQSIGPGAKAAAPALASIIKSDPDDAMRRNAIRALSAIDPGSDDLHVALRTLLLREQGHSPADESNARENQKFALDMVASLGPDAKWAAAPLTTLLISSGRALDDAADKEIFALALSTVQKIGPHDRDLMKTLREMESGKLLTSSDSATRHHAAADAGATLRAIVGKKP